MDPVLLYIAGHPVIRWYGLMYVVGILVGLWMLMPYARARGIDEDSIWSIFWPATIGALLGARLYYVAQQPDLSGYFAQPWRILATWEGGMAFYGAIFGAAAAILYMCHRLRLNFLTVADCGALFAVLGQAFGRIGNIINGDVVGYPTDLPWGFIYLHPNSFVAQKGVAYQPAAVYELLFNLFLFLILWRLRFRLKKPGLLFVTWLIGYSLGQIIIFTQRMNDVVLFGLKQAQVTAIVVIIGALPLLFYILTRPSQPADLPTDDELAEAPGPDIPA